MNSQDLPFDPSRLLNHVIAQLKLKNDAALARVLEVAPPVISKVRHNRLGVGPALKIRIMEKTDLSVRDLNYLLGTVPA